MGLSAENQSSVQRGDVLVKPNVTFVGDDGSDFYHMVTASMPPPSPPPSFRYRNYFFIIYNPCRIATKVDYKFDGELPRSQCDHNF